MVGGAGPVVGGVGPVVGGVGLVVGGMGLVVGGAGPMVGRAGPMVRGALELQSPSVIHFLGPISMPDFPPSSWVSSLQLLWTRNLQ